MPALASLPWLVEVLERQQRYGEAETVCGELLELQRRTYGRENGLIDGLSLTIRPGERIGLIGRSGAGKSTLVNLMLRFFDLEDGKIVSVTAVNPQDGEQKLAIQVANPRQVNVVLNWFEELKRRASAR